MFYVYVAYNEQNLLRFIGTTTDMKRRMKVHCFRQKKEICRIVYYEIFDDSKEASNREMQLQSFSKKLVQTLVDENNPMLMNLLEK